MLEKRQTGYYIQLGTKAAEELQNLDYAWSFTDTKGKKHHLTLSLAIPQVVITEAQEVTDRCRSMSTTDMGIEQMNQNLMDQIQAAILAGEKDKARDLIEKVNQQGSFYSREWQAYHPLLYGQCFAPITDLLTDLKSLAQAEQLTTDDLVPLLISFVQNLTYGGQNGVESPIVVLANREGTCAARTYMLTLLLRGLGKECQPFGSQDANHMMVGIAIKAGGNFCEYKGKKYYLIETTAPDFKIGQIDKHLTGDLAGWQVIEI